MLKNKLYNLLRWSEKYTHTDMVYLATGSFWLTSDQIISSVISFGLSIIYANFLSKEIFGTYKYILSAYGLISIVTLPGIYTAVTQSISRGFDGSLSISFKKKLRWGMIGSAIALAIAIYYLFKNNQILGLAFTIVGIFLPIIESYGLYVSLLEGKKLFKQKAIFDIIITVFSAGAIILTIYLSKNIYIILLSYFLSLSIPRVIYYYWSQKKYTKNDNIDPEINNFTTRINAFQIFSSATQYIDKILLFTMLGAPQLAVFSFAIAIPERIKGIFRITSTVSFPKFANKSAAEIRQNIINKMLILGLIIALAITSYILLAPLIFKYLFPQYVEVTLLSQVLAATSFFAITYPIGAFLSAHKKVKALFIISSSSFILGLIFMIIYIPTYGVWGAVIGLTVNRLVNIATSFYYLYKA